MLKRYGLVSSGVVCLFALIAACSSSDKAEILGPGSNGGAGGASGGSNRAGAGGKAGSGGTAGGSVSELAPQVEITAPVAATDPNVDPVLIANQVTALCNVAASMAKGAAVVDPSTVKIELFDADGKSVKFFPGTPTPNEGEYSATFPLASVPTGPVSFKCTASDKGSPVHVGSAAIDTFVDHGPAISIIEPENASAHAATKVMNVAFEVAEVLLTPSDNLADVGKVTLMVAGVEIKTTNVNGKYSASVPFTDKDLFGGTPPSGKVQLVITAENSRKKPGPASASLANEIVVDGTGPVINLVGPPVLSVIGRGSVLSFTVTDAIAGVDQDTVTVTLNQSQFPFSKTDSRWTSDTTGAYTFKIGAALSANSSDSQVTVNVTAKDKAGNVSTGTSRIYDLDTQPPTIDLDPPPVYEVRPGTAPSSLQCSDVFDPVGSEAPSDLDTILNFGRFRAVVWDEANFKEGLKDFTYAGTKTTAVQLFVQFDTSKPLLTDNTPLDGNSRCDTIDVGTAEKPLPFTDLQPVAVTPRGAPSWGNSPPALEFCKSGPTTATTKLCGNPPVSDMSVVIRHDVDTKENVIYAVQPIAQANEDLCTGKQWDVSAAIKKVTMDDVPKLGWVCAAVRAEDNAGNTSFSRPIRVCLTDSSTKKPCEGIAPPSCTNGCTPPPHFTSRAVRHD